MLRIPVAWILRQGDDDCVKQFHDDVLRDKLLQLSPLPSDPFLYMFCFAFFFRFGWGAWDFLSMEHLCVPVSITGTLFTPSPTFFFFFRFFLFI